MGRKSAKETADEKRRFYMYLSYEEQMDMLTDEELGRVMRYVYDYANTGVKAKDEAPLVNMMLSIITTRYDIDKENYVETVERNQENGEKGGHASAEARRKKAEEKRKAQEELQAKEKMEPEEKIEAGVQKGSTASLTEPMDKMEPDRRDRREEDEKEDDVTEEEEKEHKLSSSSSRSRRASGAARSYEGAYTLYGEEQIPTTNAEITRTEALTEELYRTYLQKAPTPYDYETVFRHVYIRVTAEDGSAYAAFSQTRADLLRHVFRTAANQHNVTWSYMEGILANYEKYGIKTAEEAIFHEGQWKRGEIA